MFGKVSDDGQSVVCGGLYVCLSVGARVLVCSRSAAVGVRWLLALRMRWKRMSCFVGPSLCLGSSTDAEVHAAHIRTILRSLLADVLVRFVALDGPLR